MTYGEAYEKGWATCLKCGTRRPERQLAGSSLTGDRFCIDLAWCDAQKKKLQQQEATP